MRFRTMFGDPKGCPGDPRLVPGAVFKTVGRSLGSGSIPSLGRLMFFLFFLFLMLSSSCTMLAWCSLPVVHGVHVYSRTFRVRLPLRHIRVFNSTLPTRVHVYHWSIIGAGIVPAATGI